MSPPLYVVEAAHQRKSTVRPAMNAMTPMTAFIRRTDTWELFSLPEDRNMAAPDTSRKTPSAVISPLPAAYAAWANGGPV